MINVAAGTRKDDDQSKLRSLIAASHEVSFILILVVRDSEVFTPEELI